eukprot:3490373-Pleurochrysis_carterae.AAC.1
MVPRITHLVVLAIGFQHTSPTTASSSPSRRCCGLLPSPQPRADRILILHSRHSPAARRRCLLSRRQAGFCHGERPGLWDPLRFELCPTPQHDLACPAVALLRFELRHFNGKHNPASLAWLQARSLHLHMDDARIHTALMYTDDILLATVGPDRIVALPCAWHRVMRTVGLTMAIPESDKRVSLSSGSGFSSSPPRERALSAT